MTVEDIKTIEGIIQYTFKNKTLLKQAFIRRSYSNEHPECENNEVLEFIGDKSLDLAVVYRFMDKYGKINNDNQYHSELKEWSLTTFKSAIVQKKNLAKQIDNLGLAKFLIMGKGDTINSVKEAMSVKEDLFEAILGAVTIDTNWDMNVITNVADIMLDFEYYNNYLFENTFENYVGYIQDWYQRKHLGFPDYEYETVVKNNEILYNCTLYSEKYHKTFSGCAISKAYARMDAAEDFYNFLIEKSEFYSIEEEIGKPCLEKAINQLQELYQKDYILLPKYNYSSETKEDGTTIWVCSCYVKDYNFLTNATSNFKKDAKKEAALEMIEKVLDQIEPNSID